MSTSFHVVPSVQCLGRSTGRGENTGESLHLFRLKQIVHIQGPGKQSSVKTDPLPLHGLDVIRKPSDTETSDAAACIIRSFPHRPLNILIGRDSRRTALGFEAQLQEAKLKGILTASEVSMLQEMQALVHDAITVDDFDPAELESAAMVRRRAMEKAA